MEQLPGVAEWEQGHLLSVCVSMSIECVPSSHLSCAPPFSGLSWLVFLPGGQPTEFFRALCSVHPAIQKNRHNDPLSPFVSASCFKHLALWHTLHEGPCVLGFYRAGVPTVWVFSKAENKVLA